MDDEAGILLGLKSLQEDRLCRFARLRAIDAGRSLIKVCGKGPSLKSLQASPGQAHATDSQPQRVPVATITNDFIVVFPFHDQQDQPCSADPLHVTSV